MDCEGLVHIYCGDGKGKTTAAVGLSVRCAGGGGRVLFYQFLKDGTSSEISLLKDIKNIDVIDGYKKTKFFNMMTEEEKLEAKSYYTEKFNSIKAMTMSGNYDLVVLDEAVHALNFGYISMEDMISFLNDRPYGVEVVLTGRNPDDEICSMADYISEIRKIKHPYDNGISARKLIES